MNSNLENFKPKLRGGRVIPQGSRIIFETDNPYNQIILPMALADMVLLCSGHFSIREIVDKVYKKQGAVPFRSILTAIHLLHQGGFFENGDQLELSPHLQSWMRPRQGGWHLAWRFGQRIAAAARFPMVYYVLTLVALIGAIFGLQNVPGSPVNTAYQWTQDNGIWPAIVSAVAASSLIQTVRYLLCGIQLLLLTSKAYNVSLRLSPWGLHLHVGDEANDLFENRLYTAMFHTSQIFSGWMVVYVASLFADSEWIVPLALAATALSFWELNPFTNSEGRKLVQALLVPNDRDVVSWHFDVNTAINHLNPQARRQDQDFARICAVWGLLWLAVGLFWLHEAASLFGPGVLIELTHPSWSFAGPGVGLVIWLAALYLCVQSVVRTLQTAFILPLWSNLMARSKYWSVRAKKLGSPGEIAGQLESLPLFSHFEESHLRKIVDGSGVLEIKRGGVVIRQEDPGRELYVLLEGRVEIVRRLTDGQEEIIAEVASLSVFGEEALVDDSPRTSRAVAISPAIVLKVPVHLLKQVALESQTVRQLEVFRNAIMVYQYFASSPVFRSLSTSSVEFLSSRGTLEYFGAGQIIFRQGDFGDNLYLILRGSVEVEVHGVLVKSLRQGSFFGEIALIANIPRTATIRTREPSVFFKISSDAFWDVLVQHMDLGVFIETVSETRLKEDLALAGPYKLTGTDSI